MASYYVNALTGLDTNSGTIGSPFKTIGKALQVAVTGNVDNIYLTYGVGEYLMTSTDISNLASKGLSLRSTGTNDTVYSHPNLAIVNMDGININLSKPMLFSGIFFKNVQRFETTNSSNSYNINFCKFEGKPGVTSFVDIDVGGNNAIFYGCVFKNFTGNIRLSRASNDTSIHNYNSFVNTGTVINNYSAAPYPILRYSYFNQPGRSTSGFQLSTYVENTDLVTESIPGRGATLYAPVPEKFLIMDNDTNIYTISGGSLSLVGSAPVTEGMFSSGFDDASEITNTHLIGLTNIKLLALA